MYLMTEWDGQTGVTESQIFSRPARPYSVNKHFIILPVTVENFESFENSVWAYIWRDYIDQTASRAEQLHQSFYNKNLSFISFFASNKKLAINRKTHILTFDHVKKANRKLT